MISIIIGVISIIILVYSWYRITYSVKHLPPGPPEWPLIGTLPSIVFAGVDQYELLTKWGKRYGPIFTFRLFNTRLFVLNKFDLIHEAFMNPDISDRSPLIAFERYMGRPNNGILNASGQTWKEQRRFAVQVLRNLAGGQEGYEAEIARQARRFVQELQETECRPIDPRQLTTMCLANVLISVALGIVFQMDDPQFKTLLRLVHTLFEEAGSGQLLVTLPFIAKLPLLSRKFTSATAKIWEFVSELIDKKEAAFNTDNPPKDFLQYYLKELRKIQADNHSSTYDNINMRESCFELLLAGWDTSATALNWILLYLIAFPDVQDGVQKEIDTDIGRDRDPIKADIKNMPFTEATICEVMRMSMIGPEGVPHLVSKDTEFHGYVLPKGSMVIGNLWGLSRDPEIWNDPDTFRPSRFLDEDGMFSPQPEMIPFGTGRRSCPGEKLARHELILFTLYTLQSFTLKKATDDTKLDMKGIASVTLCPKPFELRAIPRE